ncbi:hypothetical protein BGX38DRAFT_1229542 [Terfezia claveryi]|nr:hypothetical protein BGX38DRAFT_1229542 [Terfezia claveryi]
MFTLFQSYLIDRIDIQYQAHTIRHISYNCRLHVYIYLSCYIYLYASPMNPTISPAMGPVTFLD